MQWGNFAQTELERGVVSNEKTVTCWFNALSANTIGKTPPKI
jgi:hypothetical protein